MSYEHFVLSDRHARQRQQEILHEVEQIRLAKQVASARPARTNRVIQPLIAALMSVLQR